MLPRQVVVLTDSTIEEELAVNAYAHANGICFISARAPGLFGYAPLLVVSS